MCVVVSAQSRILDLEANVEDEKVATLCKFCFLKHVNHQDFCVISAKEYKCFKCNT